MEEAPDPVIVTDAQEMMVYINRAGRELVAGSPLGWLEGSLRENFRPVEGEEGVFLFASEGKPPTYWRIRSQSLEENEGYQAHYLSDVTQLRNWQERAALSEMKASLAEGLVHDAGNMVSIAYQKERNIEGMIDGGIATPESAKRRSESRFLRRLQAFTASGALVRFSKSLSGRLTMDRLMMRAKDFNSRLRNNGARPEDSLSKGVKELGSLLSETVKVFQDSQRMLRGVSEVRILPIDLLLEKALRLNEGMRERSRVRLITDFGEEPPIMMGEESPLLSAVLNLLINACHAMPKGGELRVRTFAENGWVTIEVQDTGVGIEPENLGHIFEPHFTTKEHSGGTGMGLANVKIAVERIHRGRITVESELDRGTTFRLILPQTRTRQRSP